MSVQDAAKAGRIIIPFHSKYSLAWFHTRVTETIKEYKW